MATILENRISAVELDGGQTGTAPIFGVRAWVNFDGTGTVAVRSSGNVSSITDNGTGDYTINLSTAMPDANYAVSVIAGGASNSVCRTFEDLTARTASLFRIAVFNSGSGSVVDSSQINIMVIR